VSGVVSKEAASVVDLLDTVGSINFEEAQPRCVAGKSIFLFLNPADEKYFLIFSFIFLFTPDKIYNYTFLQKGLKKHK
jgi:hypothetical protein